MVSARPLCILLLTASLSQAADLSTYDGKKATGVLLSADTKEIVMKTAAGTETFDPNKVSAIDFRPSAEPAQGSTWIEVQLVDGSQFHCSEVQIKEKQIVLTLLTTTKDKPVQVTAPLSTLFYMIRDFQDPKIVQQFRAILSKRSKRDVYIFNNNINDLLDRVDGTFGDADEKGEKIIFEREDGVKNRVAIKRIAGIIFNPGPMQLALTLCRVIDLNKNEIYVKGISVATDQKITLTTTSGVNIEYSSPDGIAKIDFSVGAMSYLSNLEPKKVIGTDQPPYRRDEGLLEKGELKIGTQPYPKGLAIRAGTVLTYDIEAKYKTFEAVVGVDANASESFLNDIIVTVTIEADNKVLYKQKIQKTDASRNLNLNVVGVKILRITVESEGDVDLVNQVDLADAKLRK